MTNYDFIDDFIDTYKSYANDYEKGRYEMGWSSQQREFAISKAREYRQLAEWLEELKAMRSLDKSNFSDGYNKALEDVYTKAKEMQLEQIKNLEQSSKRNGKMWARYMITYLGHIENACKRLFEVGGKNDN